jgi:hypothetical protein
MATVIVRVTPPDFEGWYEAHMRQIENFKEAGVTSEVMYRDRNDEGAVMGILEVEDADRFFEWLSKQEGPARYRPTFWILDEVEKTI